MKDRRASNSNPSPSLPPSPPLEGRRAAGARAGSGTGMAAASPGLTAAPPEAAEAAAPSPAKGADPAAGPAEEAVAPAASSGPRRSKSLRRGRLVDRLDVPWQRPHSDGGRKRGIHSGLSGVRICPGGFHISSGATRINGDAQDGRCRGSLNPQLAHGIQAPEARRTRGRRNPGIGIGLSIWHVVIGADANLGLGHSCGGSKSRSQRGAPRRALTILPERARARENRRRARPLQTPGSCPGACLMAGGLGGRGGRTTHDNASIATMGHRRPHGARGSRRSHRGASCGDRRGRVHPRRDGDRRPQQPKPCGGQLLSHQHPPAQQGAGQARRWGPCRR